MISYPLLSISYANYVQYLQTTRKKRFGERKIQRNSDSSMYKLKMLMRLITSLETFMNNKIFSYDLFISGR